jgi:hypothetical protein
MAFWITGAFVAGWIARDLIGLARVMCGDRTGNSGRFKHWTEE